MTGPSFATSPAGTRIAHRFAPGVVPDTGPDTGPDGPTIIFLPGYLSDMAGAKATAVYDWARARGHSCLCLDYSGCGMSGGDFAEGTLSRWRDEVLALISMLGIGRVVLVGSSMGGWLMLLVALALAEMGGNERIAGLIGIAAAPDFTDWGLTPAQQAKLAAGQPIHQPNPYGEGATPVYPGFWADAQARLLLGQTIGLDCPVRLFHGMADVEVPWSVAPRLAAALRSATVRVSLIKDGDHRFSRAGDIAMLLDALAVMMRETAR